MKRLDLPPVWTLLHLLAATAAAGFGGSPLGPEAAIAGWLIIAASLGLGGWAAFTMRQAGTPIVPGNDPTALVTAGPFRFSRNPIYVGFLGILAGWCLVAGQPLALVLLVPLWLVLRIRFVLPEEQLLRAKLGAPYDAWAASVPRWLFA